MIISVECYGRIATSSADQKGIQTIAQTQSDKAVIKVYLLANKICKQSFYSAHGH